jgi:hypothetical protein
MSAVTFALTPSKSKAQAAPFVRVDNEPRREEVFRIALDRYIAEYRKHHAATTDDPGSDAGHTRFPYFRTFAGWFGR